MTIEIREQLVSSRDRTWDGVSACTSITVHETANVRVGADAQSHADLQSDGNVRQASWHIQVDDREAIRSFPDEVRCWHAGKAAADSIAIEICVNADGNYDRALANAAAVVALLRAEHGLGRGDVKQHHDWTGKHCPARLRVSGAWAEFVAATDPAPALRPPTVGDDGKGAAGTGGGKSVATMAAEIIAGLHGVGHDVRRRSLGISLDLYSQVRAEVNRTLTGSPNPTVAPTRKSIAEMASEVIDGRHGQGHDNRRRSLGITTDVYTAVRAEVNRRLAGPSPAPNPTPKPPWYGRQVRAKVDLRFYDRPGWHPQNRAAGVILAGQRFAGGIHAKRQVGGGEQYQVSNSRGRRVWITASPALVDLV